MKFTIHNISPTPTTVVLCRSPSLCGEVMFLRFVPRFGVNISKFSVNRAIIANFSEKSSHISNTLTDITKIRLEKINEMKLSGVQPYAYGYEVNTTICNLRQQYSDLLPGQEDSEADVSLAGRIMVRRFFGKLAFFELQDHTDTIQLYIEKNRLGEHFKTLQSWTDNGDIIGVQGTMRRTDKGELSIYIRSWKMLTKALLPLPDKYHGLTDIETRYRNRHVDMIVNKQVVDTLRKRSLIIQSIRR